MQTKEAYLKAGNRETSSSELWYLYQIGCKRVKQRVAENPSAPEDLIEKMAQDPEPDVKSALARNSAVTLELLENLCSDDDINVKLSLAAEPSLPMYLLEKLSCDQNPYVRDIAEGTIDIQLMEESLASVGFEPELMDTAKLGELFYKAGIVSSETLSSYLDLAKTHQKPLGHILIHELSVKPYTVVKALMLQAQVRKGKLSFENAIQDLKAHHGNMHSMVS